ncbi:MAG: HAMP domain-containing histidine kinase [Firmicutes bacterium]|nr:HAMP domain-containing histidine kinase [Bacillota bacterium]
MYRYRRRPEEIKQCRVGPHRQEFYRYHRYFRLHRPLFLLFTLLIIYLLFSWVGYKAIGIIFAVFIVLKEGISLFFFWRLEKRIFQPIVRLNEGVQEIARGNYNVTVQTTVHNEIGQLINSFNRMARQLQESERLKLAYEESRRTLVANISHDLKTPIATIQGYIEAIQAGAVPPEKVDKYLQTIQNNTAYINKLIDDLLLFSQLDVKKLEFHFEDVRIKGFLSDLMEEFRFELEEKGHQLLYRDRLEEELVASIDLKRINQAIRNIIGNAVKYGPDRGLELRVDLYRRGDYAAVDIEDNGPGIPEDKLPHIFERFYRVDTERTKDLMSTGLGLAITRELIEAHQGRVSASSTVGQGSRFTIELPVKSKPGDEKSNSKLE